MVLVPSIINRALTYLLVYHSDINRAMKYLLSIVLLLGLSVNGIAQDLLIVAEPGLRVYIDNTFKGFTSEEQDGILIKNAGLGKQLLTLKDGAMTIHEAAMGLENGTTEYLLPSLIKNSTFPNSEGYYFTSSSSEVVRRGFKKERVNYYWVIRVKDGPYKPGEQISIEFFTVSLYADPSLNTFSLDEFYKGVFLKHSLGNLSSAEMDEFLFNGVMKLEKDRLELHMPYRVPFEKYSLRENKLVKDYVYGEISGEGKVHEDNLGFTVFIKKTENLKEQDNYNKEWSFRFVHMPDRMN